MAGAEAEQIHRAIGVVGNVVCQPLWIASIDAGSVEGSIEVEGDRAFDLAIVDVGLEAHRRIEACVVGIAPETDGHAISSSPLPLAGSLAEGTIDGL